MNLTKIELFISKNCLQFKKGLAYKTNESVNGDSLQNSVIEVNG